MSFHLLRGLRVIYSRVPFFLLLVQLKSPRPSSVRLYPKDWGFSLVFLFFFSSCNISSESFYSKTLQRRTRCLRESSDKSIATHNTCLLLNNGSYLDRVHSTAVLLMCFTTKTKGINIFCVFLQTNAAALGSSPPPPLFNSRRQ